MFNSGKIIYLDDTLLPEKTFQEVLMAKGTVISLLQPSWFCDKFEKICDNSD